VTDEQQFTLALAVVSDYQGLLLQLDDATDQLLAASQSRDVEAIEKLIQTRSSLCDETAHCAHALESALEEIGPGDDSVPGGELRAALERVETSQAALVVKQAECERTLSTGLRACRSELADLSRRRELPDAYSQMASKQDARFLDSRL
jgi:hypothetical protein